jgi:hypothetical protein
VLLGVFRAALISQKQWLADTTCACAFPSVTHSARGEDEGLRSLHGVRGALIQPLAVSFTSALINNLPVKGEPVFERKNFMSKSNSTPKLMLAAIAPLAFLVLITPRKRSRSRSP